MATDSSGFAFLDPTGAEDRRFAPMTEAVSKAHDAFDEERRGPRAGRMKSVAARREALAKAVAGTSWRKPRAGLDLSREFRTRPHDGREWPSATTTKQGAGTAPPVTFVDLSGVGNYFDWRTHAPGAGRFTDTDCYCDIDTRRMGGYIRAVNTAPDNDDDLQGYVEGGFWFSYTPSRDCGLSIRGLAIQTYSRQFRDLIDQPGAVSNVQLFQTNYLTCGYFVDGPGSQVYGRTMCDLGPGSAYTGDGDHANESWGGWGPAPSYTAIGYPDVDELVRNGERSLEFDYRPTIGAQGGVAVHCFIGARSSIDAHLDDVEATIRQGAAWTLRRLAVWEV